MKSLKKLGLAIAFTAISWTASAFNVSPMVAEFDPNTPRSQQVFVLSNTTDKEKPIEVTVVKPHYNEEGGELMEHGVGEDLFLIIPQQFVLPPNSRRSVKVFYVGDPMEEEDTYRLLFKELPVALAEDQIIKEGENSFRMAVVMQYYTRVWLTPSHLEENLNVTSFDKVIVETPTTTVREGSEEESNTPEDVSKVPMLRFTVANTGGKHGYLRFPKFDILTRDGKKLRLSEESIDNVAGQVVFKESQKEFKINWEEDFPDISDISEIRLRTTRR